MAVKPIPEGFHSVTPYLVVEGAEKLLDFLGRAFGAEEKVRMHDDQGATVHAEVTIGDSIVMLGETNEKYPATSAVLNLYVTDCDGTYQRAIEAGATSVEEPTDQFYGDRSGGVRDPAGNTWWISTHVEDVSDEEMAKRSEEWAAQQQS